MKIVSAKNTLDLEFFYDLMLELRLHLHLHLHLSEFINIYQLAHIYDQYDLTSFYGGGLGKKKNL